MTWVYGDQHVLVQEVVDTLRERINASVLDSVSISAGPAFERQVWAAANQFPLNPGSNRMILIHDADKLSNLGQLETWMSRTRSLPGVYLVFVAKDAGPAVIKAPRGSLVKCVLPKEDDAVAWVQRRAPMDAAAAKHLLTRTGGNLAAAAGVCAKVALFDGSPSPATIDSLVNESPGEDFADTLIALDKRRAVLGIEALADHERLMVVALLDTRLDLLQTLHRVQHSGRGVHEISGVNPYLARTYLPHARHYDTQKCAYRRRVLAVVDDALRSGARDGVFEALVALW